jgi:ATP-dependent Clp protease protease subunit
MIKKYQDDHEAHSTPIYPGYVETYVKLSKNRIIFLNEDITKQSASELSALLLYYDNENSDEISIYINSNGGDAAGLSNIYDVMQMITSPIKTICIGKCYSAAALILAAGTSGNRYAFKSSKIMIHGIQAGFPIPGHDAINSKNYYDYLKNNNDNIMKILAKHTNHSLDEVKQTCLRDVWMTAKEALKYNLIDHIL